MSTNQRCVLFPNNKLRPEGKQTLRKLHLGPQLKILIETNAPPTPTNEAKHPPLEEIGLAPPLPRD